MTVGVIGLEEELILATPGLRDVAKRRQLATLTVGCVKEVVCAVRCVEGANLPLGFMVENGGRIYIDGEFVESATPEVLTPLEAVVYQRANERVLLEALTAAKAKLGLGGAAAKLVRRSSDGAGHYVGLHVSVQTKRYAAQMLVEHLVPFLVSRFYACAGSLGVNGFCMSHKHAAIKTIASKDSRQQRGIVHLKDEPLAVKSKRVHITHGDLCMSDLAVYLTVGCTALVVRMLDDGVCVGPAFKLENPVAALRTLDADPSWTQPLPLASGGMVAPIDIQEHYLRAAERYVRRADAEAWMPEVVSRWRWAVDQLRAKGPGGLSMALDPYIKLRLHAAHLRRRRVQPQEFSRWSPAASMTSDFLRCAPDGKIRDVKAYLRECMPSVKFGFLQERVTRARLDWPDLVAATALYEELLATDFEFHDIAPRGLYFRLRGAGAVDPCLFGEPETKKAMRIPPEGTRARPRSDAIQEVASDSKATANWGQVTTAERRLNLADPQATSGQWQSLGTKGGKS